MAACTRGHRTKVSVSRRRGAVTLHVTFGKRSYRYPLDGVRTFAEALDSVIALVRQSTQPQRLGNGLQSRIEQALQQLDNGVPGGLFKTI